MEVHNTVEDTVIPRVNEIFDTIEKEGNPGRYCTCKQCRMDTVCYVLNRTPSRYILSNRGASRVDDESFGHQQEVADITTLIHEGLERVNHNQRPNFSHSPRARGTEPNQIFPVFNIPTIMGRLFKGDNFEPMSDVYVELLSKEELVPMKDGNWPNPCRLVSNTGGNFSFWPAVTAASRAGEQKTFEFTLRVSAPGYETLTHFFKIPAAGEIQEISSFTLARTFKISDLYMFPPGEAEKNG